MIYIQKKPSREAVEALRKFVKAEGSKALYDNFKHSDGKAHLQESLAAEQYYLCAYCMRRIHYAEKIEHWITRDTSKKSIDIACRGKSEVMSEAIIRKIISSWKKPCYNEDRQREELKEFCGIILSHFSRFC